MKREMQARIDEAVSKAGRERDEALQKTKEQVDRKRKKILSEAKRSTEDVVLSITKKDIESIVHTLIGKYLEE
ncbi:MAG: hypothetical protein KIY11_04145 [Thermoplasmata archaeon]|nr:hypothetical protein [Candidatus Sysuiplasma acidicola]